MPLYEYLCEECAGIFEVVRPIAKRRNRNPARSVTKSASGSCRRHSRPL